MMPTWRTRPQRCIQEGNREHVQACLSLPLHLGGRQPWCCFTEQELEIARISHDGLVY